MPLGVELERIEVEPRHATGGVHTHEHAAVTEAGVGMERIHRTQMRHRRPGTFERQASGPSATEAGPIIGLRDPAHDHAPCRTERPSGNDATHPWS